MYKQDLVDMLEVLSAKKINKSQIKLTPFILIIKNQTPNKKHMLTFKKYKLTVVNLGMVFPLNRGTP